MCKKKFRRDVVAVSLQIDLGSLCSWQKYQNGTRFKKVIEKYKINGTSVYLQRECSTSCRDVTDILLLSHWVIHRPTRIYLCIIHLHVTNRYGTGGRCNVYDRSTERLQPVYDFIINK